MSLLPVSGDVAKVHAGPRALRTLPRPVWLVCLVIFAAGWWLREPTGPLERPGPDEVFYADYYVKNVSAHGPGIYPRLFEDYVSYMQEPKNQLVLPPGRMTFVLHASLLARLGVESPLEAARFASLHGSLAFLALTILFALRWIPLPAALCTSVLVACAPLQIHLAHRALIDGYFAAAALAALWTLWESTRPGAHPAWALALAAATAAMILTKENSAFVVAALAATLGWVWNRERPTGHRRWMPWVALAVGVLSAAVLLWIAAADIHTLFQAYALNVAKSNRLEYAILTGDGPLHRLPLDFLAANPAVTLLGLAALVGTRLPPWAPRGFLTVFTVVCWLAMSAIRYSMNLRYALIGDFLLAVFAGMQVQSLAERASPGRVVRQGAVAAVLGLLLCLSALQAGNTLFGRGSVYDPVPLPILEAWRIHKRL